MRAMKLARLYGDAVFQGSSDYEAADIAKAFGIPQDKIRVAMDLPAKVQALSASENLAVEHGDEEKLRVIFLSRITPMKNLDFALRVLAKVSATLRFDIYGPISDQDYWEKCQALMKSLPANVMATYCGSVAPARVAQLFSKYDLFFLPTRGENYGHVIAEALSMGTPVLISDQTPWRELQADGLGWDIPLASVAEFACTIQALAMRSSAERRVTRPVIQQHAIKRLLSPAVLEANRRLFNRP